MKLYTIITILWLVSSSVAQDIPAELLTVAEQSQFQATSKHAEVQALCEKLAKASSRIKLIAEAGKTLEGKAQPLLIVADPPVATPAEAKKSGKVIVMAFANIHAGEVDGKEAVLMLARELGLATSHPVLKDVIVLIYPNLNADGNDRFALNNRPGQVGPVQGMGIRANAQGLDLNRDFIKLDSPEVRCLVKLFHEWNPHIIIDCHTTNGSHHRHVITYDCNKHPACDKEIVKLCLEKMMPEVSQRLDKKGGWKSFFYGNFNRDKTVWETYGHQPRFSTQYCALRQRIGILSESYSYASYKDRVLGSKDFVHSIIDYAAAHRAEIIKTLEEAATRQMNEGGEVALRAKIVALPGRHTILGYVEKEENGKRVRTDEHKEYAVTYVGGVEGTLNVKRPAGYLVPRRLTKVLDNLKQHGIFVIELEADGEIPLEVYEVTDLKPGRASYQNHQTTMVEVSSKTVKTVIKKADYVLVNVQQPLGNLASFLLEPQADDGLAFWGLVETLKVGSEYPILRIANRP
jgi:dipeptidyl-peptidase 4